MRLIKFDDFVLDINNYNLSYQGKSVSIRPKTLKLLSLLIQNRHRILSKDEIMLSVWGNDHARDYQLFQLISELRKPPFRSEFVRTQPNEGYQWNVATKKTSTSAFVPQLIAASVVTGLVCFSLMTFAILNHSDNGPTHSVQLPAFNALSKGIAALENGEKDKAVEWFEFALLENPGSVEPSLFLAETLYQQNKPEESSKYLQGILSKENLSVYNKAVAANILSRISEQQGKLIDALLFAQKSAQIKVVGQCSIDFVEQRIVKLESEIAMSPVPPAQDKTNHQEKIPVPENYARQCNELSKDPVETSSCIPFNHAGVEYASIYRREKSALA
jgi:DNA-binding winged helix-turn-helix (wHTH) protein